MVSIIAAGKRAGAASETTQIAISRDDSSGPHGLARFTAAVRHRRTIAVAAQALAGVGQHISRRHRWRRGKSKSGKGGRLGNAGHGRPGRTVKATADLLKQTMGGRFSVQVAARGDERGRVGPVRATRAKLEAAVFNLAVDARDAMPDSGSLSIAVSPDEVTGDPAHPAGLTPGRYARITVADTGVGMDATTLRRATEAFFTTKPPGHGTG